MPSQSNSKGFRGILEFIIYVLGLQLMVPYPSQSFIAVIYNKNGRIIRRLEQIKVKCIGHDYVDFFNSSMPSSRL